MPLAIYVKALPKQPKIRRPKTTSAKKRDRLFFASLAILGLLSIAFAVWPLLSWQINVSPKFASKIEENPVPDSKVLSENTALIENVQIAQDPDGFSYFTTDNIPKTARPKEFYLSVPKLKINKALV